MAIGCGKINSKDANNTNVEISDNITNPINLSKIKCREKGDSEIQKIRTICENLENEERNLYKEIGEIDCKVENLKHEQHSKLNDIRAYIEKYEPKYKECKRLLTALESPIKVEELENNEEGCCFNCFNSSSKSDLDDKNKEIDNIRESLNEITLYPEELIESYEDFSSFLKEHEEKSKEQESSKIKSHTYPDMHIDSCIVQCSKLQKKFESNVEEISKLQQEKTDLENKKIIRLRIYLIKIVL